MSKTYKKQPDLWLGKHFNIDAYVSLIEMDDGTARILIKKPSGQAWAGEIEEIDRIPSSNDPESEEKPPSDTDDLTREVIAELVETLRELIHHWWNDSWAPTPNQKSPVVTTPQEAYYRAHALYRRHKHLLEEDADEIFDLLSGGDR
jgi:hypothetical protein